MKCDEREKQLMTEENRGVIVFPFKLSSPYIISKLSPTMSKLQERANTLHASHSISRAFATEASLIVTNHSDRLEIQKKIASISFVLSSNLG